MAAYVIAAVTDAWDQDKLVEYRERNTAAVARYGGRFIVRGGRQEILEGSYTPVRVVIIEFPDLDSARGWYDSDEYAPLRELRQSASDTDILVVEGVSDPRLAEEASQPTLEEVLDRAGKRASSSLSVKTATRAVRNDRDRR